MSDRQAICALRAWEGEGGALGREIARYRRTFRHRFPLDAWLSTRTASQRSNTKLLEIR